MKTIAAILSIALLFPVVSSGLELSGELRYENGRRVLRSHQGKSYNLGTQSVELEEQLAKLSSGDFLVADGLVQKGQFQISNIQSVGLRRFLGFWTDSGQSLIEVTNYREFRVHRSTDVSTKAEVDNVLYSLAPEPGAGWSLLLLYKDHAVAGRLWFEGDTVFLEFSSSDEEPLIYKMRRLRSR